MKKLLLITFLFSFGFAQTRTDVDTLYADVVRVGGLDFSDFGVLRSTADYQIARIIARNSADDQMSALELQGLTNNVRLGFDDSTSILGFHQNITTLYKNSGTRKFAFDMVGGGFTATGGVTATTGTFSSSVSATSVTGTSALTMGGNSALTHAIRSSSFPPLYVTRTTNSATASAGSIALSGWNSANAEVEYAMIGSQVVLNTAGIHSGNLIGRITRGGTRYIGWWLDTLQRFSIVGDGRTSPLSTTATFSVKNNNYSANIMELYRYGSASTVLSADSLGAFRTIGGTSTAGAYGVAPIVDTITYGAVSSSIASRNLPSTAGTYRISYFMAVNTAGTGGTVQATISYNNGVARTLTSASLLLTLTTESDNNAFIYKVTSGTPTIAVTVTGGTGSPVYSFDAVVERLK